MAFGELFNPGMANARKQLEAERILPAPPPVAGPPPFEFPDLGVDFDVTWSLNPPEEPGNDNGAAEVAPSSDT